jgi:metallo-beta-lactamase superfamily protein
MSTLKAMIVPVTQFQQNCAILWDEKTKRGAVSDPGGDVEAILKAIEKSGVTIEKILLTHGHIDHAGGAAELAERLGVEIEGPHTEDLFLLEALPQSGAQYGMRGVRAVTPDRWRSPSAISSSRYSRLRGIRRAPSSSSSAATASCLAAMCCSRVRSAVPISLAAIMPPCSLPSAASFTRWATM